MSEHNKLASEAGPLLLSIVRDTSISRIAHSQPEEQMELFRLVVSSREAFALITRGVDCYESVRSVRTSVTTLLERVSGQVKNTDTLSSNPLALSMLGAELDDGLDVDQIENRDIALSEQYRDSKLRILEQVSEKTERILSENDWSTLSPDFNTLSLEEIAVKQFISAVCNGTIHGIGFDHESHAVSVHPSLFLFDGGRSERCRKTIELLEARLNDLYVKLSARLALLKPAVLEALEREAG